MQYLYADITVAPFSEVACDVLSAMLSEAGFDSFEMTDTGVKAYIAAELMNQDILDETLRNIHLPDVTFTYTLHRLEDKDWNEEWEENGFEPVLEREFGILLHPHMAFGSGAHETTHQLVELLMHEDFTGQRVLDMGTGTGVLGIAMAKRNAREIEAIDIDEFSVENARENFALNNINNVRVRQGDATAIEGEFQTIVANIHRNILTADMPTYVQHLSPNGTLYVSGFFTTDVPAMQNVAQQAGLTVAQLTQRNDWAVMKLKKN